MIVRGALLVGFLAGTVALAWGPIDRALEPEPAGPITDVHLLDDVDDAPALPAWPLGVVDTANAVPGSGRERPEPAVTPLTYDEAARLALAPNTVVISGPPTRRHLLGVGSVVTRDDVATLAALDEPHRTDVVRFLAAAEGAALSVFSVGGPPDPEHLLVARQGAGKLKRALLDEHPEVRDLLATWAQIRPELAALIDRDGSALGPEDDDADRAGDVAATVTGELLPALERRHVPVAPALLTSDSAPGLLDPDSGELTPRGAVFAVAARVLQPGSSEMPVETNGPVVAHAVARPGGGAGLLLWNPGAKRTVTILAPDGERALRLRVRLAPHALTGVTLGAR